MMREFPNHDEFAHDVYVGDDVDPNRMVHNGIDTRYYRNAPRYDEAHVNTSSSSSASHHTPDHSPKSACTVATTVVHANDTREAESAAWNEERDAPEDDMDYREDDGGYNHNHEVPNFGTDPSHATGGPNSFVPIPYDAAHPHGFHYHHMNQYAQQPMLPPHGFDPNYHHPHPHYYGHPSQHHYAAAPPHPQYHYESQQPHPNDPSYYTNAFDVPIPDHYQQPPTPNGEVICIDDETEHANIEAAVPPGVQVVSEYNERDILCGRGALMIWHPGNKFFRRLVQTHRQRYFFSRRQEKKKIATQIMEEVRAHGGRFLRRSQSSDGLNQINVWVEIDEERAYQKTCQALREGAPEIRKQWRNKPSSSSSSSRARAANTKREETKENADNAASSK